MILTAFRLIRDYNTEGRSFGYERSMWPGQLHVFNHYAPNLGSPIEIDTTLTLNLVKIVELYNPKNPVIIERLAWQDGSQLYPYRVKYIRHHAFNYIRDEPVVFLSNLSKIHRKITGIDASLTSPLQFYLDRTALAPDTLPPIKDYILHLCHQYSVIVDGFTTQDTDTMSLRDFLTVLDSENVHGAEQFILPKLATPDPISPKFMYRSLHAGQLQFPGSGAIPFDVSPPSPLQINHPEVTLYSPPEYHHIARSCDDVSGQYSDVKLEYILSNSGYIVDCQTHYKVSRYLDHVHDKLMLHYCNAIVMDVYTNFRKLHPSWSTQHYCIILEVSYGDEVLIEIYTQDKKCCLFAVHLDLAKIALCAADIITQAA